MKAWVIKDPHPDAQFEVQDIPVPSPGPGELLVRVQACGINPIDLKTSQGKGLVHFLPAPPWILGWDLAGEVTKSGKECKRFAPGDQIMGLVRFPQLGACFAEYVVVPEHDVCSRPPNIGPEKAAGLPLAGLTAWQCYEDAGISELANKKKTILILGANGGVGHLLLQLGLLRGAEVWGYGSAKNRNNALDFGAHGYLAYDEELPPYPPQFSAVIDAVGDVALEKLAQLLEPKARILRLVGGSDASIPRWKDFDFHHLLVHPDAVTLESLAKLVSENTLELRIQAAYEFNAINEAFAVLATGRALGKIVLKMPGA